MDKRGEFLRMADEVAKDSEPDPWTAEPWPDWFQNVVLRLTRVFIPTLKREDLKKNRERFEGYGLAFVSQLMEEARKVDTTKFPENPVFEWLKSVVENIATVEAPKIQAALHAAIALPTAESAEVFAAFAKGLKKHTADFAIKRMADNQTAQICLFLIFARPSIEAKKVPTVTVLFEKFMKIKEAVPGQKEFFRNNADARRSLEQHFRKICTTDKVKLAGRGQPKRNKTKAVRTR